MLRITQPASGGGGGAAVYRDADGQLWLDPDRVEWVPEETFQVFVHEGVLYELWGRRGDGKWWIGEVGADASGPDPAVA
jgi:hypothetical protein